MSVYACRDILQLGYTEVVWLVLLPYSMKVTAGLLVLFPLNMEYVHHDQVVSPGFLPQSKNKLGSR